MKRIIILFPIMFVLCFFYTRAFAQSNDKKQYSKEKLIEMLIGFSKVCNEQVVYMDDAIEKVQKHLRLDSENNEAIEKIIAGLRGIQSSYQSDCDSISSTKSQVIDESDLEKANKLFFSLNGKLKKSMQDINERTRVLNMDLDMALNPKQDV